MLHQDDSNYSLVAACFLGSLTTALWRTFLPEMQCELLARPHLPGLPQNVVGSLTNLLQLTADLGLAKPRSSV